MKRMHTTPYSQCREASIYKGVSYDEANGMWVARFEGQHLGYYESEEEAAKALKNQ